MILQTTTTAGTFDLTTNNNSNITFGTALDGYGGGLHMRRINMYIGYSDIADG